jgi:hypothetical protein
VWFFPAFQFSGIILANTNFGKEQWMASIVYPASQPRILSTNEAVRVNPLEPKMDGKTLNPLPSNHYNTSGLSLIF